jgi:S1-C subfamily serine protease
LEEVLNVSAHWVFDRVVLGLLIVLVLVVGSGAPGLAADAALTPQQRAELRKKVEEQLKKTKPGQPAAPEKLKGLSDELESRLRSQLKQEEERPRRSRSEAVQKNSKAVLGAFREAVSAANRATIRVVCDGKDAALGTIVGSDGWVLTKHSQVKGKIVCRLADGRELPARVVGVHDETDLAMLKVEAQGLAALTWNASSTVMMVGDWVASAGLGELPTAIGVVSVGPRKVSSPRGILGIVLEQADIGPKIIQIMPDSGAAKAGLKVDDIVLGINGKLVKTREELIELVGTKYKEGDTLTVEVKRGGGKVSVQAKLGRPPQDGRANMQNTIGGAISERRSNFPQVLQHDTVLRPADCGGPLVDLDGKAVGLNIARAGRVESYALPAEVVVSLIADLKSGRLAPWGEYEKQLSEALTSLKTAETSVQQAKGDLDRIVNEAQAALKKVEAARAAAAAAVENARQALEQAKAAQSAGK